MSDVTKKNVCICWNDNEYICNAVPRFLTAFSSIYNVETVLNQEKYETIKWENVDYLIVLCELKWSHKIKEGNYSDFNGIKLVQHLRYKKDLKIPVLFASIVTRNKIIERKKKEVEIINTLALKHGFVDLRTDPEIVTWLLHFLELRDYYAWKNFKTSKNCIDEFKKTKSIDLWNELEKQYNLHCENYYNNKRFEKKEENLKEWELSYLKRHYCDIGGIISLLKHNIGKCGTKEDLQEQFDILKDIAQQVGFNDKIKNLSKQIESLDKNVDVGKIHTKFENICAEIESILPKTARGNNTQPIKYNVLYLEDEPEDSRIQEFKEIAESHGLKINFISEPTFNKELIKSSNAIICDIIIEEKPEDVKLTTCLGVNYIDNLVKCGYRNPLFIVLSDVSPNLHFDILDDNPYLDLIRKKKEVIGSSEKIDAFVKEIIERINNKVNETAKMKCLREGYFQIVNASDKTIEISEKLFTYYTWDCIEKIITENYKNLKNILDEKWGETEITEKILKGDNNTGDYHMIEEIENLGSFEKKFHRENLVWSRSARSVFVVILIARRLFIYILLKKQKNIMPILSLKGISKSNEILSLIFGYFSHHSNLPNRAIDNKLLFSKKITKNLIISEIRSGNKENLTAEEIAFFKPLISK